MSVKRFLIAGIFLSLCACQNKKYSEVTAENDSLRQQIEYRNNMLIAMDEINTIADSIMNMHGTKVDSVQYRKYFDRIAFLHQSVMISRQKIAEVKEELNSSRDEAMAYNMMVIALQDEVSIRDGEIIDQEKQIRGQVKSHRGNMAMLEKAIAEKDQELLKLQRAMEEIKRLNAAESYFIKAQRLEDKARKMIFAQRKKKENLREALELYQQSLLLGKAEAAPKIASLKKMI